MQVGLDIVALSSLNEGTPVGLIEAQASCKPVVSTKIGGVSNVVVANETGLLSSSKDLDSFAKNLLELVENGETRLWMGSKGWQLVHEKYHYNRLVKDTKIFTKNYFDNILSQSTIN